MNNRICAVIVTYNRIDFLKGAIEALKAQTLPVDILVVNNGSSDGTKEFLDTTEGIKAIHQENVGGAGGFYTGIKWVVENNYDFVWVMDDDVIPSKECVKELYQYYIWLTEDKQEKVGYLCSKVTNTKGESVNLPQIDMRPGPTGYPEWNKYLQDGVVKITEATFVSVFIPTKIVFEVGLPIKEFFIWGDDTEYTLRITQKYTAFQIGKSVITHLRYGGALSILTMEDAGRVKMLRYLYRNHYWMARRGYKGKRGLYHFNKENIKTILILLSRFKMQKANIILKSLLTQNKFNPKIDYIKQLGK